MFTNISQVLAYRGFIWLIPHFVSAGLSGDAHSIFSIYIQTAWLEGILFKKLAKNTGRIMEDPPVNYHSKRTSPWLLANTMKIVDFPIAMLVYRSVHTSLVRIYGRPMCVLSIAPAIKRSCSKYGFHQNILKTPLCYTCGTLGAGRPVTLG